jgi:hypothetical protein
LRRIFGPKRDEETGEWRRLYKEKQSLVMLLLTKYNSGGQIKKNEKCEECSMYGERAMSKQGFGGETRQKETTWKTQA